MSLTSSRTTLGSAILAARETLPRHIVDMRELSAQAIEATFNLAACFEGADPRDLSSLLSGRVVATIFYQPSTRTRLNFESAAQRLGLGVVGFCDPATTRAGDFYQESLEDVVRFTSELVDLIVLRHHQTGAAGIASGVSPVPVMNAGDGYGQHPTQALGDIWTMRKCLGDLRTRSIGMLGDVNIRSLKAISMGLATLGVGELVYLLPPGKIFPDEVARLLYARRIRFRFVNHVDHLLNEVDLIETIGVNHPNHASRRNVEVCVHAGSESSWYQVTREKLDSLAPGRTAPYILHPGPRTDELARDVDGHPSARYFHQARNGMWVRMALMAALLCGETA